MSTSNSQAVGNGPNADTSHKIVEVSGLTVTYGDEVALSGVSLEASPGEFLVLMGPSGSGKSTLLHALAGLQRPSSGGVRIGGTDLWASTVQQRTAFRLERIGLVFQTSDLVPELSLLDNVALPMELAGASRRESLARAALALDDLGIDQSTMRRGAGSVSGGQQQRAAVARALANRPELVLADEPTGALDAESRRKVLTGLANHAKRGGVVIVATHDSEVVEYGTRVIHVRDGVLQ